MDRRILVMGALAVVATAAVASLPPISQSQEYHQFADTRTSLGIANALNVLSNVPFLLAGLAGLLACRRPAFAGRGIYALFFLSIGLVSFGSGYYHLAPDNDRLVWDRLPMTLGFNSLLAAVIAERIDLRWGRRLLAPLLAVGLASVMYWQWTETRGAGDLRPYALVQFLSLTLIVAALSLFRDPHGDGRWLWGALGCYALAKLGEHFDGSLFALIGLSGHSLKHVLAALGIAAIAVMIGRRRAA